MNIITREEITVNFDDYKLLIEDDALFIHPTDTIYGLGCDATSEKAVKKVREIKGRVKNPFSVIAPGKQWILDNCIVNEEAKGWIAKFPGPYTLILKLKNKECIAPNVNSDMDSLGVRIPDHWISKVVQKLGVPIVTTSANKAGEDFMMSLDKLNLQIERQVSFIIYEGEKHGRPSTIVDLTKEEPLVKKR